MRRNTITQASFDNPPIRPSTKNSIIKFLTTFPNHLFTHDEIMTDMLKLNFYMAPGCKTSNISGRISELAKDNKINCTRWEGKKNKYCIIK